jgi:CDP-glycerol glycerophosphotransferase
MGKFHDKLDYVLKHNIIAQFLYKKCLSLCFRFWGLFLRRDPKLILFSSFAGKKYNDSPKVLFERMRTDKRFEGYHMVWAFVDPDKFNIDGAEKVKIDTLSYFITALKAGIWITSVNIERGLSFKPRKTIYINTWHGAGTKKIGNACNGRKDYNLFSVDMMLVQSKFEEGIFLRDFQAREDAIRMIGFPRNDELFHITKEQRKALRKQFNIPDGKKVILYAPTWRDSKDGGLSYTVEPPINMKKWRERMSGEYVMLFRMHTFTTKFDMVYDDFARDTTSYDNLNHILAITDVLVTDYSTIVYDSAVAGIPFICFGFDYDTYRDERGFYFDLNKVYPGGVLHTEDEVMDRIEELNIRGFDKDYKAFREKYIEAGGNATNQILDELASKIV